MPAGIPSQDSILTQGHDLEVIGKILYRDSQPLSWTPSSGPNNDTDQTEVERSIHKSFWQPIATLLHSTLDPSAKVDNSVFTTLLTNLKQLHQDHEKLILTPSSNTDATAEPPLISETHLNTSYTALEVLRALPRLTEHVREKIIQAKAPHRLKSHVPKDWAKAIDAEVKATFETINKVAQSHIDVLQKNGAKVIKAQVRWGKTGECIRKLLRDEDVAFFAGEYVDCAVEAWRGVGLVRVR